MTATLPPKPGPPSRGQYVANVSHLGRFWDVFLEFDDDPKRPDICRGVLCFCPSDRNEGEQPRRTTAIIVESSYEDALHKARSFEQHQLVGFLRSVLPD